eukprot:TRINITY_DN5957_c0_g2_i1.p1 TRINITY_DN5957_c0_g2~~TRINITY_DN5957_c0_g2_i1.p1  ORF type:complete len:206 (-),score=67.86 TRINITY_DN5957_c0_g2_i1:68-685(-)
MSEVLIVIANGSEEIESCCAFDILKRAGAKVTLAKVPSSSEDAGSLNLAFAHGLKTAADISIDDAAKKTWDMIIIPGGLPGTEYVAKSPVAIEMLKKQKAAGKWIGAICAAPALVLAPNGLLDGEKATAYPSVQEKLPDKTMAKEMVVVSNKIVTSQSPGTAFKFALELAKALFGEAKMEEVRKETYSMVCLISLYSNPNVLSIY